MSYLGNLNPYMTQSNYAEEMRKRNQMLTGPKPAPQMSMNPSQAQMSPNREPTDTEKYAALLRKAYKDNTAQENALEYQRDSARSLLATKDAGPRQLGNVVVNNPWEGLSVGISRGVGGYMMGKAAEKDKAMQADRDLRQEALIDIKAGDREYARGQEAAANKSRDLRDAATVMTASAAASTAAGKIPGQSESERNAYVLMNPEKYSSSQLAFAASRLGAPRIGTGPDGAPVQIPGVDIGAVFPDAYRLLQGNVQSNQGAIAVDEADAAGAVPKPTYTTPTPPSQTTTGEREKTDLASTLTDEAITSLFEYAPSYLEEGVNQFPYPLNAAAASEGYRSFDASRSMAVSVLGRMLSGAEVKDSEIERITGTFIPRAGDTPEILAEKKQRLLDFLSVYRSSGLGGVKAYAGQSDLARMRAQYGGQ
jgi:hypothetical protein